MTLRCTHRITYPFHSIARLYSARPLPCQPRGTNPSRSPSTHCRSAADPRLNPHCPHKSLLCPCHSRPDPAPQRQTSAQQCLPVLCLLLSLRIRPDLHPTVASPNLTTPLLIPALRCETAALHNIAITFIASANHRPAFLCHGRTRQPDTKPCTAFADRSLRCQSMPMLCCSILCAASALLTQTVPNHRNSNPCRAGPLPYMETQLLALPLRHFPEHIYSLASLCIASNAAAYRHKALPSQGSASFSVPLLSRTARFSAYPLLLYSRVSV